MQLHTNLMSYWHIMYDEHDCCDWLVVNCVVCFGALPISVIMLPDFWQKYMNYVA